MGTEPPVKYERKCENWLSEFMRWTLPRSEAPETYIMWTGIFTLASALRRHVKIPKTLFGSWEASPNLYILFIADAGKARKSTTANYTEDLLDFVPDITMSPELITKESLLNQLVKSNDASMCIVAPEFGEFMVKSGPEMYSFLTNMYDGKKKISASTITRGPEFAERPCVNLLGATTPSWVAENMPESVIGGGFASRVIFIFEEKVRRRQLYYESLDFTALESIRRNLVEDLQHIATQIHGEFQIDEEAKGFMEHWYRENADKHTEAQYKMHGYFERKPAHIHKVAMIVHLSYADDLVLNQVDFEMAIKLIQQVEKKLPRIFQGIGKNPYTIDIKRIHAWMKEMGRVTRVELFKEFFHAAAPDHLDKLIKTLLDMDAIRMEFHEGITTYFPSVSTQESSPKDHQPESVAFDPL